MSHARAETSVRAKLLFVAILILAAVALLGSPAWGQTKDQLDAAAAYERAMVFFRQGAHAEAEKDFRNAERRDDTNLEYVFAAAYNYLKLHKPDDALRRYERIYKKDPTSQRALAGMAASYEEMQNYREAVRIWQRYVKMDLPPAERDEGIVLLKSAQELFAARYEIAENPAGGAPNAASMQEELQLGAAAAQEIASTGLPTLADDSVNAYVQNLCQALVKKSKDFPSNYELFILDTATVNAMAMPGFIVVFRGTLEAVESEAELATVLAHEIGHSVAHHGAKKVTKAQQDQQSSQDWQKSNNAFLRFLGRMAASGNQSAQLAFSREQEEQADRLGVHIAFDAGFDPRALTEFFQKLESESPSSRKSWDLMQRTHPFSIDRINTITAYVDLLPARSLTRTSPEFERMKVRLAALPLPPDATGQMKPALDPSRTTPPASTGRPGSASGGGVIPYSIDNAPFAGEIPAGWTARKAQDGTIIFEGERGTEAYQVTVKLEIAPKANVRGQSIDDVAETVYRAISTNPRANIQPPADGETNDGRPARTIKGSYSLQGDRGGLVPCRHSSVIIDYPSYYVVWSYFAPETIYENYGPSFQMIGERFRYTGR